MFALALLVPAPMPLSISITFGSRGSLVLTMSCSLAAPAFTGLNISINCRLKPGGML
jgi:hypothetical protein